MAEDFVMPRNLTAARSCLKVPKGVERKVVWHHFDTRAARPSFPIRVHPEGKLDIEVRSGIPALVVESGHVVVRLSSRWGNSLTIRPGASAHVVVGSGDTKVTIHNEGTLTLDQPEGEKHRILVFDSRGEATITRQRGGFQA